MSKKGWSKSFLIIFTIFFIGAIAFAGGPKEAEKPAEEEILEASVYVSSFSFLVRLILILLFHP